MNADGSADLRFKKSGDQVSVHFLRALFGKGVTRPIDQMTPQQTRARAVLHRRQRAWRLAHPAIAGAADEKRGRVDRTIGESRELP